MKKALSLIILVSVAVALPVRASVFSNLGRTAANPEIASRLAAVWGGLRPAIRQAQADAAQMWSQARNTGVIPDTAQLAGEVDAIMSQAKYADNPEIWDAAYDLYKTQGKLEQAWRLQQAFGGMRPRGSIAENIRSLRQIQEQARERLPADLAQTAQELGRAGMEAYETGVVPHTIRPLWIKINGLIERSMVLGDRTSRNMAVDLWDAARPLKNKYDFETIYKTTGFPLNFGNRPVIRDRA